MEETRQVDLQRPSRHNLSVHSNSRHQSKKAAEMWKIIAFTYAKPNIGHIQQLKHQLKQYSKGDKTIDEYLQGLTTRFDQLALLGKPIEHEDKINYILKGLPEDYKSVVDQVESRDTSPTITEVHEKLLTKEAKLFSIASSASTVGLISANTASARPRSFQGKQNQRQNQTWNNNNQQPYYQPRPDNRNNNKGYQGRCQLCSVFGHSAKRYTQLQ